MKTAPRPTKKEMVTAFRTREILAAARSVLEQRGLEALTMEEIAQAAGVAKGTVYLYFQGKDHLLQALMSQVGEQIITALEAVIEDRIPPREKLARVVALLLDFLERERILFPIYARGLQRPEAQAQTEHWKRIQEQEEKSLALLTRLFAAGIQQGQFIAANPRLLAFLLRSLIRGVGYYQMVESQKHAVKEALPVLLSLLSSGLSRQADTATGVMAL